MNILIITFSPAGSTLKVSNILKGELEKREHSVQLMDITRNKTIFIDNDPVRFLLKEVKKHDVICIGSPVYEKHLEYYVRRFMKQLPKPDSVWGKLAIPFVTYGGISSGNALQQSHSILKQRGRKTVAAMKLESSHIKCDKLKTRVNENMPGDESIPYIDKLVSIIDSLKLDGNEEIIITKRDLRCHGFREKIFCTLMNEKIMHKYKYPQFKIVEEKCCNCFSCVQACPIQRIGINQEKPDMKEALADCIHCFSCVNACSNDAITFVNEDEGWKDIDRIYGFVSKPDSFVRSTENPKSEVYPIKN